MYEIYFTNEIPDPHLFGRGIRETSLSDLTKSTCDNLTQISDLEYTVKLTGEYARTRTFNYNYCIIVIDNIKYYYIIKSFNNISPVQSELTLLKDLLTQYENDVLNMTGKAVSSNHPSLLRECQIKNLNTTTNKYRELTFPQSELVITNDLSVGVEQLLAYKNNPFYTGLGTISGNSGTYNILVTAGKNDPEEPTTIKNGLTHFYAIPKNGSGMSVISNYLYGSDIIATLENQFLDPQSFILDFFNLPLQYINASDIGGAASGSSDVYPVLGKKQFEEGLSGSNIYYFKNRYGKYFFGQGHFFGSTTNYSPVSLTLAQEPYSKYQLYLPFIGLVDISLKDMKSRTFWINLVVDYLTGDFVYNVYAGDPPEIDEFDNLRPVYRFEGNMAQKLPIAGSTKNLDIMGIGTSYVTALTGVATGNAALIGSAATGMASNALNALNENARVRGANLSTRGYFGKLSEYSPYLLAYQPSLRYIYSEVNQYITAGGKYGLNDNFYRSVSDCIYDKTNGGGFKMSDATGSLNCTQNEYNEIVKLLSEGVGYKKFSSPLSAL